MIHELKAVFRGGVFIPQEPCEMPEETQVQLIVQPVGLQPPKIIDPTERAALLEKVVERMTQNPLPLGAKPFTREELYERR